MKHRERRTPRLSLAAVCIAALATGCGSDADQGAGTKTNGTETSMNEDVESIERPAGAGRELVATPMVPTRSQGVTVIVFDAVAGDQVSFGAESGTGADFADAEWESLPEGSLVEWGGGVIEVTDIQSDATVVFTLWND